MKKLFYVFILFALVSCGSQYTATFSTDPPQTSSVQSAVLVTAQSIIAQMDKGKYKEGELLVKFKSGVVTTSSLKTHGAIGAMVIKKLTLLSVDHVRLPQGVTVRDAIIQYMQDPNVEYAEPNYILRLAEVPNDLYFGQQWALRNTGQFANGTPGADIKAADAWNISKVNTNTIIAVVDTGIDYNHVDLFDNVISGWNFIDNNSNTMDDVGHGTHVAGIIGAVGNNNMGVSGVLWRAKVMPLKVCNVDECPVSAVSDAITYAASHGASVINVSLGTYPPGSPSPTPLFEAVNLANNAGVLVIAAAGNEQNNNDVAPVYPASYNLPNVISVTATDQNDTKPTFSNFGGSVHVAAPGVYILSTVPLGVTFALCTGSPYAGYDFCTGTSMAAPHVSGLAGLLYSYYNGIHNTQFNLSQVRNTIFRYGDVLPTLTGWIQTGKRINAHWAVSSLLIPTNLSATATSPTQISITWSDNAAGEDGYKIERKVSGGSYTQIAVVALNTATYPDSGLSPTTTYTYRVRAYNTIPADSSYSNEASATTPAVPVEPSGGGGGCSIGARQNTPTAVADFVVMLIPLLFVVVMKFRRRV